MFLGCVWDVFGMCLGYGLLYFWDVFGMCVGCVWDVFGMFVGCVGDVFGIIWDPFLCPLRIHFGVRFGPIREHVLDPVRESL